MTTGASHPTDSPRGSVQGDPRRPGRSRARSFLPLGLALWLVLEIWLLILVGEAAGGFTVFLLLVAGVVLGAIVIKRAGRRAWQSLTGAFQPGATGPGARRAETGGGNALPMLGGLLLMLPGLLSDVVGLLCLFPPTGNLLRRRLERSLERKVRMAAPGGMGEAFQQARMRRPDGKVVQGEVIRDRADGGSAADADRPRREDPPLPR
ncbi:FxsA family membrane protein [Streptomyces palmae]|uniref:FxsA family protein n=1 Tax=Streptomyces palmae TaxID=1701085 RepID=A0A4Z0HJL4_9ACTN|nr:FxsA family membrane protein [Streptomyces palmae]TGB18472.1 FxsA family protein [Streptomyces palmae]